MANLNLNQTNNSVWKEVKPRKIKTFQLGDYPELVHFVELGYKDIWAYFYEDGYEVEPWESGLKVRTKEYLETTFKISLEDKNVMKEEIILILKSYSTNKAKYNSLLKIKQKNLGIFLYGQISRAINCYKTLVENPKNSFYEKSSKELIEEIILNLETWKQ